MAFNMNKLTEKAQEAVLAAQELAQNNQNSQIEPEHLMAALLAQADGVVPQILSTLGVDVDNVAQQFNTEIERLPKVYGTTQQTVASQRLGRVLENANQQANNLKDDFVSTEHLLLALIDHADGATAQILNRLASRAIKCSKH